VKRIYKEDKNDREDWDRQIERRKNKQRKEERRKGASEKEKDVFDVPDYDDEEERY